MKQGGRYGVRLKASAPSIHIARIKQKYRNSKQTKWAHYSDRDCCHNLKVKADTQKVSAFTYLHTEVHYLMSFGSNFWSLSQLIGVFVFTR